MADQFSIGEVAWWVKWGCSVTIDSSLRMTNMVCRKTGDRYSGLAYRVTRHDNMPSKGGWSAMPRQLRKLPPPEAGMKWEDLKQSLQPKVRA